MDYSADWVILARRVENLESLATNPHWRRMNADPHRREWTDDYSNVLGVIKW